MQKNSFGLLGVGLLAVIVGLGLYWNAARSRLETPTPDAPAVATGSEPQPASAPQQAETSAPEGAAPTADKPQAAPPAPEAAAEPEQSHDTPVFDVLRVEPDGAVVVAGKATANSDVEVVAGATVVGKTRAGANGDFAVVLDAPLKPGDHQLVLRTTGQDRVATSAQTAIVSVPDKSGGQVLALVEEPGQASRLITRPDAVPEPPPVAGTATDTGATGQGGKQQATTAPAQDRPIAIEAVEIEGDTVFVAGSAKGGNRVIVHANDILLGSSPVSPEGRFLVQSRQPLAVADYIIRADLLDNANGIVASARVPFRREAGANVSAVAPAVNARQEAQPGEPGADAAVTQDAAALQKVEGSVIIRRGDNLWTISKRTYGEGTRYTTIYLANREQIRNPDLIWPGQVFTMPRDPLGDEEVRHQMQKPAK